MQLLPTFEVPATAGTSSSDERRVSTVISDLREKDSLLLGSDAKA
jgi:hypothetical protein